MNPQRPWGFRDFVRMRGYSSLYLFSVGNTRPIKVGITDDPLRRLGDFQVAHYHTVDFLRVWWLPGKLIAARIKSAFKYNFIEEHIRGEWFDVTADDAIVFVHDTVKRLGTWGISQAEIEDRMMRWARKHHDLPKNAPVDQCGLRTMRSRSRRP